VGAARRQDGVPAQYRDLGEAGSEFSAADTDTGKDFFSVLSLSEGHMYVDYNAPRGNVMQFDTPVSSLRSYDRSVFRVDAPDQFTDVSVFRGSVHAEGRDGNTRVNAGRTLTLGEGREAEPAPVGRADVWQNWNTARDRRFASRGDSYRYLPEELRVYSSDLDDRGGQEIGYIVRDIMTGTNSRHQEARYPR
jgi:ferric-dicitrate binding protein FerR (iron transport regulator)